MMVVPSAQAAEVKPHSSELKSSRSASVIGAVPQDNPAGSGLEEEQIPPGAIYFWNVPADQVAPIYAELLGRKLDLSQRPPSRMGVISMRTITPVTKAEAVYALETLFGWQGLKVVPVGDSAAKLIRIADGQQP